MTKAEVISAISDKTGLPKDDVKRTLESFFKVVKLSMLAGNEIFIRGFASFILEERKQKVARNISAGTPLIIPAHKQPVVKFCKEFKEEVKEKVKA